MQLASGLGTQVMIFVASAATLLMAALLTASTLEMTVLWCGAHVVMPSICSVYRSGWVHTMSNAAPCAEGHGSSKLPVAVRADSSLLSGRLWFSSPTHRGGYFSAAYENSVGLPAGIIKTTMSKLCRVFTCSRAEYDSNIGVVLLFPDACSNHWQEHHTFLTSTTCVKDMQ